MAFCHKETLIAFKMRLCYTIVSWKWFGVLYQIQITNIMFIYIVPNTNCVCIIIRSFTCKAHWHFCCSVISKITQSTSMRTTGFAFHAIVITIEWCLVLFMRLSDQNLYSNQDISICGNILYVIHSAGYLDSHNWHWISVKKRLSIRK